MKKKYGMNLDVDVIDSVDRLRGYISRSTFVNETLRQKIEEIEVKGGVIGRV